MSLIPTLFHGDSARKVVVHIHGDVALANARYPKFAKIYKHYINNILPNAIHTGTSYRVKFTDADSIDIVSAEDTDYVTIHVQGTSEEESSSTKLQGFLVTPMDGADGPDRTAQLLFAFDFDKTQFASQKKSGLFAGNRRTGDGAGNYFSWDGTGGGDMAHEPFELIDGSSANLQNPNAYAKPYAALSGYVYSQGEASPVLDGSIYGLGVSGSKALIADFKDSQTVRLHLARIVGTKVQYERVIGTATVSGKYPVNFSENLKSCVVGDTIVDIIESKVAITFQTQKIPTNTDEVVVRSGFRGNDLLYTLRKTTRTGAMSNFSPHSPDEYGLPDSNYGPIDTHGHMEYQHEYYEVVLRNGNGRDTPAWTGKLVKDNHSTIIKKPVIVFQGIMPTVVYAWLRTVSITKIEDTNRLYWYKDYNSDAYVRLNWSIGYSATIQYEGYGIPEPFEGDVRTGRGLNVGGNVVEGNNSPSNWFYAVSNGLGDYILRTAPNGQKSDALLVSKTGAVKRITNTYSVAII